MNDLYTWPGGPSVGTLFRRLGNAAALGHGDFDFIFALAAYLGLSSGQEDGVLRVSYDNANVLMMFEDENTLYNVHDAGNFMTGLAFKLIGVLATELQIGAQFNELFQDTDADQNAIRAGSNYKGVYLQTDNNSQNPIDRLRKSATRLLNLDIF
jgi:hypothetical protein